MPSRIKVGIGQDSHALEENPDKALLLAGVAIKSTKALKGNSDSDVVLHAITNAISSISGVNILGEYADTLCQQGITDSQVYLLDAFKKCERIQVSHIAVSIEAGYPKISPYIQAMRESIAKIMSINITSVGITAHSGESLSDYGKKKGIFASAVVTVYQTPKRYE